jgi:hypothetical protein
VWRQAPPADPSLGEYPEASEVRPALFTRFVPVAGQDGQLPPIQTTSVSETPLTPLGRAGQALKRLVFGPPLDATAIAAERMRKLVPLPFYTAAYETAEAALADLDAIEQAHKDEMIGQYDAAVIDKEDGKPHVVKRMDRPHIRVIPEWFGGGTLPRKELHEAAEQLTANQAGLIAVGEPTIEKGLDKALTKAAKVVKRTVEATTDEITSELQEALKS